ncbi:uncharacterized protein SAPINGB_P004233 [Magnusiomyces paraingens]|uniref:Serine/threonine-protein kinase RIO2 n=1 Tax=Magnusiomyces paraingens TaxID=2606893 RepID=A0A5E8BYU2_9ASCO|nr:uncharacterized protein SAPINGB_P004233 [Saprochaete ingens]VVT54747.1 unnamed protein product [Saprochaete ingens]
MKFDTTHMRYLSKEDFRVLTAVEMGSKNHEIVAVKMINQLGGLRSASRTDRCISELAKVKCISKIRNAKYDGYRLTYLGNDYLALKAFTKRETVYSVGNQIGIGKESDIYIVGDKTGASNVLKIHRLGRISFRTVKNNRDYLKKRQSASWMYLSRLAAQKEFQFMKALYDAGFEVPVPIDTSRHMIVMSLVEGFPMRQLTEHGEAGRLYKTLMKFIIRLACAGLIHCDFNEFNIMIRDDYDPAVDPPEMEATVIDFPQCVSISHPDAQRYFERDVNSIRHFFDKKLGYVPADGWYPEWERDVNRTSTLDALVEASGYSKEQVKDFEQALSESREAFGAEKEFAEGEYDDMLEIEEDYTAEINGEDNDDEEEEDEEEEEEEEEEDSDLAEDDEEDDYDARVERAIAEKGIENMRRDKLGNYILD